MSRMYPLFFFALIMLAVPVESAVSGVLTKFSEVRLKIEVHPELSALGLDKDSLKNHVLVWVRSNLPRLVVNDSAVPFLKASVLLKEKDDFVYGYLSIQIVRKVTIKINDEPVFGVVWQKGGIAISPLHEARVFVRESLDQLLTQFSAVWHRDNP